MANGSRPGERLARLEERVDQLRKEIGELLPRLKTAERLDPDVAKLLAWRESIRVRFRKWVFALLWVTLSVVAQYVSGAWAVVLRGLARQFGP